MVKPPGGTRPIRLLLRLGRRPVPGGVRAWHARFSPCLVLAHGIIERVAAPGDGLVIDSRQCRGQAVEGHRHARPTSTSSGSHQATAGAVRADAVDILLASAGQTTDLDHRAAAGDQVDRIHQTTLMLPEVPQ